MRAKWWRKKNEICDELQERWPDRAARPISVREGTKLREEVAIEKHDGGYRSASTLSIVRKFLTWYNGYRFSHLIFVDPEGDIARAPMVNSHQPQYGSKYYAKIKTLEREVIKRYENPHSVLLTFSGSNKNALDGWRCMADHIRDIAASWENGVYDRLRYILRDYEWEYCTVFEKHQSGYGHMHVAVFVDGKVEESDFHGIIDEHLFQCDIAYRDAHDYYSKDPNKRPIKINRINPQAEIEEEGIRNLGSYIGEYIGAYGKPLFERELTEIVFRAVCWATGTQVVRFSNGANQIIREADPNIDEETIEEPKVIVDPEAETVTVENEKWELKGIGRIDQEGESQFEIRRSGVSWVKIDGSESLDPPVIYPSDRPQPEHKRTILDLFNRADRR